MKLRRIDLSEKNQGVWAAFRSAMDAAAYEFTGTRDFALPAMRAHEIPVLDAAIDKSLATLPSGSTVMFAQKDRVLFIEARIPEAT